MKRGLMEWNRTELPEEELANRIAALRQEMAREKLDAILAYGDSYETGDLNYLTNFSPYWFNAMLVLTQDSDILTTVLNARVHGWIKEVSRVSEIKGTKNLGREAAAFLQERGIESKRIGVTRLERLPYDVYRAFRDASPGSELIDATPLVESLRLKPSQSQVNLLATAARMSLSAIEATTQSSPRPDTLPTVSIGARGRTQCEVAAEIEHKLRYAGSEDLMVLISSGEAAPNWPAIATEVTIEGAALVRVVNAYKGHWTEVGRTIPASDAAREANRVLLSRFQSALEALRPGGKVGDVVAKLRERPDEDYPGICAIAPYTALPDVEGEWGADQVIPQGAVVILRAGLITPEGVRVFHSDSFLVREEGAVKLS